MFRYRIVWPVLRPACPVFLVGVIFPIGWIVSLATAAGEVDHVCIAGVLGKERRLLAETVSVKILVKLKDGELVREQEVGATRRDAYGEHAEVHLERWLVKLVWRR